MENLKRIISELKDEDVKLYAVAISLSDDEGVKKYVSGIFSELAAENRHNEERHAFYMKACRCIERTTE